MNIELAQRFRNDLSLLDPNMITLVLFDKSLNALEYHQIGIAVKPVYISYLYKGKDIKYGILYPGQLSDLITSLERLINNKILENDTLCISPEVLSTSFYTSSPYPQFPGPFKMEILEYVGTTSRLLIWITSMVNYQFNILFNTFKKLNNAKDRK